MVAFNNLLAEVALPFSAADPLKKMIRERMKRFDLVGCRE
jgi:hypothetical protein